MRKYQKYWTEICVYILYMYDHICFITGIYKDI